MKKKFLSLFLAAAMVVTSVVPNTTAKVASAGSEPTYYQGLYGEYFKTTGSGTSVTFTGNAVKAEVAQNVNYSDMDSKLSSMVGQDNYAGAVWTGYIKAPEDGEYTLYSYSDNGARVYVDDEKIIDYWNGDSWDVLQTSKKLTLKAGEYHKFKMEYFDYVGGAHVMLYWTRGEQTASDRSVVPADAFYLPTDYEGPQIDSLDADGANLKEGAIAGSITLTGRGFTNDTAVEIVNANGNSFDNPMIAEVTESSATEITFSVPDTLKYGTYKVCAQNASARCYSTDTFFVDSAKDVNLRKDFARPDWLHLTSRESQISHKYLNLNGYWQFDFDGSEEGLNSHWENGTHNFSKTINVPYCWESSLSGIQDTSYLGQAWYSRTIKQEELATLGEGKQYFLYFGAVDWKSRVFVNGHEVGYHEGGYTPFEFNITEYLNPTSDNNVTVWVEDKASYGDDSYPALVGKQGRNAPCGYTHTSGIWQSVLLEARESDKYLDYFNPTSDVENSKVTFNVGVSTTDAALKNQTKTYTIEGNFESKKYNMETGEDETTGSSLDFTQQVNLTFKETGDADIKDVETNYEGTTVTTKESADGTIVEPTVDSESYDKTVTNQAYKEDNQVYLAEAELAPETLVNQKLWNYNDPQLYYGTVTVKDENGKVVDTVETYFGQREVGTKVYDGNGDVSYITMNGNGVYLSGLLDQGFWEQGIYTAPTEEDLKYDIEEMRKDGFNMIRKHIKIEDPIQYYWCDKMGMIVWQDMPHATDMQSERTGQITTGRACFEDALKFETQKLAGRHCSFIAIMLFNETWGLGGAYGSDDRRKAISFDNYSTKTWVERLYHKSKEWSNGNLLIEDMSACNYDHVQPTDLKTYHFYPAGHQGTLGDVRRWAVDHVTKGDTDGWKFGNKYDGEPILNSEYGGVGAYEGDYDISYCFKFMTDIQRRFTKQSGFVYTEPYDVEYERNGILTYDRKHKVMGYDEVAYGDDMTIADLTTDVNLVFDAVPDAKATTGSEFTTNIYTMNWTPQTYEGAKVQWRFDGTDVFGNSISTGIKGNFDINLAPYKQEVKAIKFNVPDVDCAGTLTAWITDKDGNKVVKNYTNIAVQSGKLGNSTVSKAGNTVILADKIAASDNHYDQTVTKDGKEAKTGALSYAYSVPDDFDVNSLNAMRVLAEVSSLRGDTGVADHNSYLYRSARAQTAEGSEIPSDLVVEVNGVKLDTVFLPDNPRDMRGTLSLLAAYNKSGTSAGDFGYLVNINATPEQLDAVKATLKDSKTLTVKYSVDDSENANKGGLRIYSATYGRYAVSPTVILNPAETYKANAAVSVNNKTEEVTNVDASNYSVEADVNGAGSFLVRYDGSKGYEVAVANNKVTVNKLNTTATKLAEANIDAADKHHVKVTLFDDQIRVYADNDPEAKIEAWDYEGFAGKKLAVKSAAQASFANLVVAPETYTEGDKEVIKEPDKAPTEFAETFDGNKANNEMIKVPNTNAFSISDNKLKFNTNGEGQKAYFPDVQACNLTAEFDIKITGLESGDGNAGIIVRGDKYTTGTDNAYGYYFGIGDRTAEMCKFANGWTPFTVNGGNKLSMSSLTMNKVHHVKVVVLGNVLQMYVDYGEKPVIVKENSDFAGKIGSIAFRGFKANGEVDNITVSGAPNYYSDFNADDSAWEINGKGIARDSKAKALKGTQEGAYATVGTTYWANYNVAADVELDDAAVAAVAVRTAKVKGVLNGYKVVLDEANDKVSLVKFQGTEETELATADMLLEAGEVYRPIIEASNDTLSVRFDGSSRVIASATDDTFKAGYAAVINTNGTNLFDNISISSDVATTIGKNLDGWDVSDASLATVADGTVTVSAKGKEFEMKTGGALATNRTVEATVKVEDAGTNGSAGMFVNVNGEKLSVAVKNNGVYVGEEKIADAAGNEATIRIAAADNKVTIYVNGESKKVINNADYVSGEFGYFANDAKATISGAKAGSKEQEAIGADEVLVTGVAVDTAKTVAVDKTEQLNVVVTPANATNKSLRFFVEDPAIVAIEGNGIVKGLKEGKTNVTVYTVDGGYKAVCEVTVTKAEVPALSAPTGVTVKKFAAKKALVSWKAVTGAAKYEVSTSNKANGTFKKVATVTTTKYTATIKNGVATYFKVTAIPADATKFAPSAPSVAVGINVPAAAKLASVKKTKKAGQAKITWKKVAGATGYYVYRQDGKKKFKKVATIKKGKTVSFTDKKLKKKVKYTYKIVAFSKVGNVTATAAASKTKAITLKK